MRLPRFAAVSTALVVTVGLTVSGCTSGEKSSDSPIISVNGSEPQFGLVPANTGDLGAARIVSALFAGLVTYDEAGTVVLDQAESIAHDETNQLYTVTLIDDATFSDGEEVTAASFVDAWDWAARLSNHALDRAAFSDILGYQQSKDSSLITAGGLVILDDSTFEIHLTTAQSDFTRRLGTPPFSPLPTAFFADPAEFGEHPIGNGPYLLDGDDAWQHGKRIQLSVNPDYEGEREAENAGVTIRFYDSLDIAYRDALGGTLDVLDRLPATALPTFQDDFADQTVEGPIATLDSLVVPRSLPHFSGAEGVLRRAAISLAIDRQSIVDDVFAGAALPARDFTSPAVDTFSDQLAGAEVLTFDAGAAQQKWAEADGLDAWDGTLQIAYNVDGGHQAWVDAVVDDLQTTLGIEAVGLPYSTLADLQAAVTDGTVGAAYRSSLSAAYPGIRAFIAAPFTSKAPGNLGKYANSAFDAALTTAASAASEADAVSAEQEAQAILLADLPAVPLWNPTAQAVYAEGIDDVVLDWRGIPFYDQLTKRDD